MPKGKRAKRFLVRGGGGGGDASSTITAHQQFTGSRAPHLNTHQTMATADEAPVPAGFTRLTDRKMHSRLLYTNPVCMLTTVVPPALRSVEGQRWNVMTISWLTATNNDGGLCLSINRRRFSAECLLAQGQFCLSVPPATLQQTVLALGKCSGRRVDKFSHIPGLVACQLANDAEVVFEVAPGNTGAAHRYSANPYAALLTEEEAVEEEEEEERETAETAKTTAAAAAEPASASAGAVSGVSHGSGGPDASVLAEEVAVETVAEAGVTSSGQQAAAGAALVPTTDLAREQEPDAETEPLPELAAVRGTVARLRCRVVSCAEADSDHWLVCAQIEEAYVHSSYWLANKLFCPTRVDVPPYLTFFGSQTFGLVCAQQQPKP